MTTCNVGQEIRKTSSASAMPTYEELATRFRPIFKRIGEDALRREQTRELPFEAVRWLREAGFGAVRIPLAHGGAGATLPTRARRST